MTPAEARARSYIEIKRYPEALKELAAAAAQEPSNATVRSLTALCLLNSSRIKEGVKEAKAAVAMQPDSAYGHYMLAFAYQKSQKVHLAEKSALEALRLNANHPDYLSLYSGILSLQRKWEPALQMTERALAMDPNHSESLILRAQALSFLGRGKDAKQSALHAVSGDPDNARSHTELGWTSLRSGDAKAAEQYFKDALRINPDSKRARMGLLEALRARILPYRWIIQFWTFAERVGPLRGSVFLVLFFGMRGLGELAQKYPRLIPVVVPIAVVLGLLLFGTFFGRGLANAIVVLYPAGRLAMARNQRLQAAMLVAFLSFGIAIVAISAVSPIHLWITSIFAAMGAVFMALLGIQDSEDRAKTVVLWSVFGVSALLCLVLMFAELLR